MKKILTVLVFICCLLQIPVAHAGMISKQEEIKMGKEVAMQLEAQYGVVHDDDLQERVERIGQSLVKQCSRQDLHYTFKVLNTDDVNALSLPGGFVYVFRGLVDFMPSDDELAGVLGHEIGHIVKKHSVHQIEKQLALSLLTIVAGAASGDPGAGIMLASTASQVLMAGYSRADEREADEQGFMLTNKAGYNPYSIYVTMCKLNDLAKEEGNPGYGVFSSHPEPEVRMKRAMKALTAMHITPTVVVAKDGSAKVIDGTWQYEFSKTVGSDKPEYRARLMAGALYLAKNRGVVDETRFITVDNDRYTDVYYDDIKVVRLYDVDNINFPTLSDYGGEVAAELQVWARQVNGKP